MHFFLESLILIQNEVRNLGCYVIFPMDKRGNFPLFASSDLKFWMNIVEVKVWAQPVRVGGGKFLLFLYVLSIVYLDV